MQEVSGVRLPELEKQRLEQLIKMGYYLNAADFLRDAVRGKLQEFEFIFPRTAKLSAVKKEVLQVIRDQPNIYADEIASKLNLDIETVIRAIDELMKEKKVVALSSPTSTTESKENVSSVSAGASAARGSLRALMPTVPWRWSSKALR